MKRSLFLLSLLIIIKPAFANPFVGVECKGSSNSGDPISVQVTYPDIYSQQVGALAVTSQNASPFAQDQVKEVPGDVNNDDDIGNQYYIGSALKLALTDPGLAVDDIQNSSETVEGIKTPFTGQLMRLGSSEIIAENMRCMEHEAYKLAP